jgi:hypothetical protein
MCAYKVISSYYLYTYMLQVVKPHSIDIVFFPRSIQHHLTLSSISSAEKVWKRQAYYYVHMEQTLTTSIRRSLIRYP